MERGSRRQSRDMGGRGAGRGGVCVGEREGGGGAKRGDKLVFIPILRALIFVPFGGNCISKSMMFLYYHYYYYMK